MAHRIESNFSSDSHTFISRTIMEVHVADIRQPTLAHVDVEDISSAKRFAIL